ncbi:tetraspanin-1 [Manduca sexta]|uniref:tetraspanin-1 n=1 Tax=Manduca sexta TaxID=7130 RepID=UPI00188E4A8F|nr:tetraspanin-1 [Manduca sexta]
MHTVGLPRTCLGFTNILCFILAFIGFTICAWCAINTDFFREVNYTVTKSSLVDTVANFMSLKLWLTPVTSVLIPIALLAMMTSCCGVLGAGCKVKCAIKSYIFLVSVLSSVAFWLFFISGMYNIYTNNERTCKYLQSSIQSYYGKENDLFTNIWDYTMVNYKCCGAVSYRDFTNSHWQKSNPDKMFPVQCCILENETHLIPVSKDCIRDENDIHSYKEMGCMYALRHSIINNKGMIIFYIIFLVITYCILILFSYCIIRGEPLLGAMAQNFVSFLPQPKEGVTKPSSTLPYHSNSSLENMLYMEEPPKKIVKVVSAVNPFQTYKFTPSAYERGDTCPHSVGHTL